ncbi:carbamate kinase [Conexibacter sp. CPCC 206217]|uniref:carbamate kinase n=1 Tax=Conexibacter sp. CPCC 206217 TaxID=3064574 RepID=UPI002720EFA4|nr:carbamate kinase [Conexibacter sp. CPCC 206217]MDO8212344.1 carbamate kinase [Conexibacter sp. CPCC 206217]
MRIVVAIGGNALIAEGEEGTWPQQLAHARVVAEQLVDLREAGHELVLTHGNGPHVGLLLLQQALGSSEAPELPLDALIAMTQGEVGYLLETAFGEVDPQVPVTTVLTRVVVDPATAAPPTKPVGPFYTEAEAGRLAVERGWDVAPDAGRGWRRVVGSPRPLRILGCEQIRSLMDAGTVVIAGGGGGIPIVEDDDRSHPQGFAGVIDKDRCSAELAVAVDADLLVLLTGVRRVALDFGTRWERQLARVTVSDAVRGLAEGEFPAGSMGPKIESATRFIESTDGAAVIASAEHLADAVAGEDGTRIVADRHGPSVVAQKLCVEVAR